MSEEPYYFISLLCAFQGVLLSLIFFIKKSNHAASRVLGAYVFLFSLGILENYLKVTLTGQLGQLVYSL